MRQTVLPALEDGRDLHDPDYATPPMARYGRFIVRCPATGAKMCVLLSDGSEWTEMGLPEPAWEHASVSCANRCPTWEEMAWVKSLIWEEEEAVLEFHPPKSQHVNNHNFCLHLWRPIGVEIPLPPIECV